MGKVIEVTRHASPVTEDDLDVVFVVAAKIAHLRDIYDHKCESIIERLKQGADVDSLHCVERRELDIGGVREVQLVIDHVCRYRLVTGSTSKLKRRR